MSDFKLAAQAPLGGYCANFEAVSLTELTGLALVSVATPMGGHDDLLSNTVAAFGTTLPGIGCCTRSEDGQTRLLGLQRDQLFVVLEHESHNALSVVTEKLGTTGYYTDQSDSWVILQMTGLGSRAALERICMLDLSPDVFSIDAVARTTMEHLSVIIVRDDADSFWLMSARSSAKSFLHALETSIAYTS